MTEQIQENFHIIAPWGKNENRYLKEIDRRKGLASDETVIGTFQIHEAQTFDNPTLARSIVVCELLCSFPLAEVLEVTAKYEIN